MSRRDAEAMRQSAHALKGAAANLSAIGVFEAARVLERVASESHMEAAHAAWRQLSAEAAELLDVLRSRAIESSLESFTCES